MPRPLTITVTRPSHVGLGWVLAEHPHHPYGAQLHGHGTLRAVMAALDRFRSAAFVVASPTAPVRVWVKDDQVLVEVGDPADPSQRLALIHPTGRGDLTPLLTRAGIPPALTATVATIVAQTLAPTIREEQHP